MTRHTQIYKRDCFKVDMIAKNIHLQVQVQDDSKMYLYMVSTVTITVIGNRTKSRKVGIFYIAGFKVDMIAKNIHVQVQHYSKIYLYSVTITVIGHQTKIGNFTFYYGLMEL